MAERKTLVIKLPVAGEAPPERVDQPPPRETVACLVVLAGDDRGRRLDIGPAEPLSFGGTDAADGDEGAAAIAEIVYREGELRLRRSSEAVEITVNEQRASTRVLAHGDRLCVGSTQMKVLISDDLEQAYREESYRLVTHDSITDTFNRRYLMESLEQLMSRSRRWAEPLSLAVVRLGNLTRYRDRQGSGAADEALRRLADVLLEISRGDDIVARISDEELAVALFHTNRGRAELFSDRVRQIPSGAELEIVVGVATLDPTILTAEIFLEEARAQVIPWKSSTPPPPRGSDAGS
jgi:diguanylate cyclase (GGDEF)-like protein